MSDQTFDHGIEIVGQPAQKTDITNPEGEAIALVSERERGFLATQAQAADGYSLSGAEPGNARLDREQGIEIVGQPSATRSLADAGDAATFAARFETEDDVEEFFLRIRSVPMSVDRSEGAELKRKSAMQLPGSTALFGENESTGPQNRTVVSPTNLDLTK